MKLFLNKTHFVFKYIRYNFFYVLPDTQIHSNCFDIYYSVLIFYFQSYALIIIYAFKNKFVHTFNSFNIWNLKGLWECISTYITN